MVTFERNWEQLLAVSRGWQTLRLAWRVMAVLTRKRLQRICNVSAVSARVACWQYVETGEIVSSTGTFPPFSLTSVFANRQSWQNNRWKICAVLLFCLFLQARQFGSLRTHTMLLTMTWRTLFNFICVSTACAVSLSALSNEHLLVPQPAPKWLVVFGSEWEVK